jgi:hypothetical protein
MHSSGNLIEGIKKEFGTFRSSSVVHIWKEANCVAHTLAREAVTNGYNLSWLEEIPICIGGIVIREQVVPRSWLFGFSLFLWSFIRLIEMFQQKKKNLNYSLIGKALQVKYLIEIKSKLWSQNLNSLLAFF